jgi:transposase
MSLSQLFCMPNLCINNIEHNSSKIKIFASFKTKRSQCPVCGNFSTSVHDTYTRTISDLPVFQNETIIMLKTRKFKCRNIQCNRKVFSEQGINIMRYSRKTVRASKILDSLSIELTGRLGSLLSKQLLLAVSPSTMTRIVHRQQLPEIKQPTVLGVDDWAYRKGVSYGTILIDMETSRPIELLKSRESADLKEWLTKYPDVKIVTRDRAGSYSSAINEVCPNAIQIADRFHLLMNLYCTR